MREETFSYPLLNLLCPTSCAGCGRWDTPLCVECMRCGGPPFRCEKLLRVWHSPAPVWAVGAYENQFRNLILTLKHDSRHDLTDWTAHLAELVATKIWPHFTCEPAPALVPIPSSWRRRLSRQEVVQPWAGQICNQLGNAPVQVHNCLRLRWGYKSQAEASGRQRIVQRRGAFRLSGEVPRRAVLIDDVTATGATLWEAHKILSAAGTEVVGAVVIASPNK